MSLKDYNPYIAGRVRASRNNIKPLNVYTISRYKDRTDQVKSKTGNQSALIFVIGIHDDKVNCLKLNDLDPSTFFEWAKKLQKNATLQLENITETADAFKNFSKNGKALFEGYVKRNKQVYTPKTYRMYNIDGIQQVWEVKLTPEVFQEFFNATID